MNKFFQFVFSSKDSFDIGFMESFMNSCSVEILKNLNVTPPKVGLVLSSLKEKKQEVQTLLVFVPSAI